MTIIIIIIIVFISCAEIYITKLPLRAMLRCNLQPLVLNKFMALQEQVSKKDEMGFLFTFRNRSILCTESRARSDTEF